LTETERLAGLPEFARSVDLKSPPANATLLVVYERENCPYCRAFREKYEPNLERDFGTGLSIRRIDAKERHGLGRLPSLSSGIRTVRSSLFEVCGTRISRLNPVDRPKPIKLRVLTYNIHKCIPGRGPAGGR
jgi:hypothetical protein